jgi:hypothetical protein
MNEQEHIFYLLGGIPRNDKWKVFLQLMMDKNATMTATPNEIITQLVEKAAAIKRVNGLVPEALVCAKKGGRSGRGVEVGRSPKMDKRDNKRDNKDKRNKKDFRKCFLCQRRGHTTNNCVSKQHGQPPKAADTAVKSSTETTSTLTTSIEKYCIGACSGASSNDCFIDCGCMSHFSGR